MLRRLGAAGHGENAGDGENGPCFHAIDEDAEALPRRADSREEKKGRFDHWPFVLSFATPARPLGPPARAEAEAVLPENNFVRDNARGKLLKD
jgi:hypothetical protein